MKEYNSKIAVLLLTVIIGLSSCFREDFLFLERTDDQIIGEDVLQSGNPNKIDFKKPVTKAGLKDAFEKLEKTHILGQLIPSQYNLRGGKKGQNPGPHAYQFQFSLTTDNYAGYLCLPQNFGGRMISTYYDSQDFNGGPMGSFFEVKNAIVDVLNHPQIDSIPEIKSVALLIYNYTSQEIVDIYGAFPYEDYKSNKQSNPYTYIKGEEIYDQIVNNIDTIVECFDHYTERPDWYQNKIDSVLNLYDRLSVGEKSIESWKRLANSLKLRMAIQIVKANSSKAKKWAEEAIQSGVIESTEQEMKLNAGLIGFTHPLNEISNSWNDTRLNASFESILKSLNHPMLDFVFDKNRNDIVNENDDSKFLPANSKIVGLRSGIRMLSGQTYDVNFRATYSKINDNAIAFSPLYVMKLSEVLFLRAEGALRGWNVGGTAENFYTEGIKNAYKGSNLKKMNQQTFDDILFEKIYADDLADYMSQTEATNFTYEDPSNANNNIESLTKIGVKWNEADNKETKLEKIITQKYIANFPYSYQSWTDIRRTGYPKIFPVLNMEDSDGSLIEGDIIRRIPFDDRDASAKSDIEKTGLDAIGGPDQQGTRIWWDLNISTNF